MHIQMDGSNSTVKHYWGYPDRVLPCTSGSGTCAYLQAVYSSHARSMLYTFILWAVIGGVLAFMFSLRYVKSANRRSEIKTPLGRGLDAIGTFGRRWMLAESPLRWLFGRVTILQVTVLSALLGYLLVFSLVGIVYKTWITPVKAHPGLYNTRTGLGGWGDRVGAFAYALTPLTIALSSRESLLSMITGIPYQHFNFLHRWTGRIIFVQSFFHTLVWTLVEGRFYKPQPSIYKGFISEQYIIFGIVAQLFITFLYIFSTQWAIRLTGYTFFRRTHFLIGVLYLGACWGHWDKLYCWMIASLALIVLDWGGRLIRTGLLHVGYSKGKSGLGFNCATATVQNFGAGDDSVIRLDFDFQQSAFKPGQHFFLCFPALSIWKSHPFTPCSLPDGRSDIQHHTYLIRKRGGITAKLAQLARADGSGSCTTSVIITGPYGGSTVEAIDANLLTVAGGTGVTSVLPTLRDSFTVSHSAGRAAEFVWVIRKLQDMLWIAPELLELKSLMASGKADGLRLRVFVTRETAPSPITSTASSLRKRGKQCCKAADGEEGTVVSGNDVFAPQEGFSVTFLGGDHPGIKDIVDDFSVRASAYGGRSHVIGAGPAEIGTLLRHAVAQKNNGAQVWSGDESGIMALDWDCRS